jgi:hypothetical protein
VLLVLVIVAVALGLLTQSPGTDAPPEKPPTATEPANGGASGCSAFGSFRAGNWPSGCWRPYSDTSPFNQVIPPSPRLLAQSSEIVSRFLSWDQLARPWVGTADSTDDYWHPTYYPQDSDPPYTIHCNKYACPSIEGTQVRIPSNARPAGGGDGHMTVVDQAGSWEYDFWQVQTKPLPAGGGTIVVSSGGRTRIGTAHADGLGSGANAARWGLLAGVVRAQEMEAGKINHAISFVTRCDNDTYVYPARGLGSACSASGESNADAPPMGARFQLDMSDAEIDALAVPGWKKTILRAIARYGMYLGDTGGGFLSFESGSTYTSFGVQDEMEVFARQHVGEGGISTRIGDDGKRDYLFDVESGIPWDRLRVIDPCVTQRTC